jgi:hypothetical protein
MSSRGAIPVAETPRLKRSTISPGDFRWDGGVGTNIERLRNFGKKFVEQLGRSVRPLLSSPELAEIRLHSLLAPQAKPAATPQPCCRLPLADPKTSYHLSFNAVTL